MRLGLTRPADAEDRSGSCVCRSTRGQATEGRIADANTIMLLQWAALTGPFAGRRG